MNIKPTSEQCQVWSSQAESFAINIRSQGRHGGKGFAELFNTKFAELAAQWGAQQAEPSAPEPELPEAAKCEGGWGDLCVYYYTAAQMHEHYAAGVRSGMGQSQWQPIETAPKDGRSFDVWVKSTKNPDYGVRMTGVYYVQGVLCGSRFPNSSWGEYASHWMPLPAVPKEQKQ